jgi:hypothetical protein
VGSVGLGSMGGVWRGCSDGLRYWGVAGAGLLSFARDHAP